MDYSHDPHKLPSTLHASDSASAATQPLLSKPYPTALDPPLLASTSGHDHDHDQDQDQTPYLQISYNYGPRSVKDLPFLILFCLFLLSTFAFGIFASLHRNPHRSHVSSFIYNTSTASCTLNYHLIPTPTPTSLNAPNSTSLSLTTTSCFFAFAHLDYSSSFLINPPFPLFNLKSSQSSFWQSLIWTLVATLILSVPFVFCLLLLLKHYTKQIVYASLPFFVIVPIFINVYWFVACTLSSRCSDAFPLGYRIFVLVFVFLVIGVIVWIFIVNWHRVELTVSIIGVASNALSRNLGLFGLVPALTLGLLVLYVPLIVFLIFALFNGEIVPKEEKGEYFCVWKQDSWVPAYYTLAILTMLWSAAAMIEAQAYVISGTIAQWYFSKDDESRPKHGMRASLRNAFGPSSGTVCFSGLLICVVRVVRVVVDNARQEESSGIVNLILRCCANALLSAVDFLNKFTINFAAITGEAYCNAARMTYELLKRNLLSTVFVETVSTRIVGGIVLVLSAIYAIVVCVLLKAVVGLGENAYIVSMLGWALLIVIMGYFVHVLDNVIDAVYVCYAIDRDRGEVNKQEVHEVYVQLPISRSHRAVVVVPSSAPGPGPGPLVV